MACFTPPAIPTNGVNAYHKTGETETSQVLCEEFLKPLGLSANALATALRVPAPRINDMARERRAGTPDTALRLARYFDTTSQFWLNLQTSYDLKIAMKELGSRIERNVFPHVV